MSNEGKQTLVDEIGDYVMLRDLLIGIGDSNVKNLTKRKTCFEEAMVIQNDKLGMGPWYDALSIDLVEKIAQVFFVNGDTNSSKVKHEEVLEMKTALLGPNHLDVALYSCKVGELRLNTGDGRGAMKALQQALRIRRLHYADDLDVALILSKIGTAHHHLKNYDDAIQAYYEAANIRRKELGTHSPEVAEMYNKMGMVHLSKGKHFYQNEKFRDAGIAFDMALTALRAVMGDDNRYVFELLLAIGDVCIELQQYERVISFLTDARNIMRPALNQPGAMDFLAPNAYQLYVEISIKVATAYIILLNFDEGLKHFFEAREIMIREKGIYNLNVGDIHTDIGFVYYSQGTDDSLSLAKAACEKAQEIFNYIELEEDNIMVEKNKKCIYLLGKTK
eukprot:CAMPEP_0113301496 /NCGR_PEP_ID=MMETSP0010_2-20120614/2705_1 /TAXON_ID=216773 ORGANISM="Corethron hystrix, Strain 308" /NCGR_SAMPLE_ID=MMETSP0010_2 /ASSEMBLY_ACC=CAM_ASM_000155 /LENGTH=390 /DNA_ID=CAMNT_0000155137 /DNA_START=160 /DNA_END=1332 /DNA_ORIENTATION=- /assembly_acc=CAM_ASM_000155